jgi:hypothetical protein
MIRRSKPSPSPAPFADQIDSSGLRAFIFGDRPLDEWPASAIDGEPWSSFLRARAAVEAGDVDGAIAIWRAIADTPDIESRQTIQAWRFLREAAIIPPADLAKRVYGAVAEVAVPDGHDLLAAYADGGVRYLNVSGSAVVIEEPIPDVDRARDDLLLVAQTIADAIGPWEEPELPPLPPGHTRITMLTPSGPHLGQGPDDVLRADPVADGFLTAATTLLLAVVNARSAST